ncbi:MAG: hypothetical protein ACRDSF_00155 [Pseudonocardiaceae bacterium]
MPPRKRRAVNTEPEEIEEIEEIEEEAPAPRRRGRPRKTEAVAEKPAATRKTATRTRASTKTEESAASNGYGTSWLVEHVNEELGTDLDGKALRVILRELTDQGVIQRDDRSRYTFKGPRDRAVLAVLKHVKSGALKSDEEKPTRGRPKKAAPAAKTPTRRGRPRKTEPNPDPDLPDFDDETDDEIEDL